MGSQFTVNTAAIFLGILLWDFTMAAVAGLFTAYARSGFLTFVTRAAGLSLIGFGVYFGAQAFRQLFLSA